MLGEIYMIDVEKIVIVNYTYPGCDVLKNIVRLPKDEAFSLANKLASINPNATSFGRFADFHNYYKLRMEQDDYLYHLFEKMGGKPKELHPLSFVLEGSNYLKKWFDNGTIVEVLLKDISAHAVSFTLGDSGAQYQRRGEVKMLTKEQLYDEMNSYNGTIEEWMKEIEEKYHYIEVQLWDDDYVLHKK